MRAMRQRWRPRDWVRAYEQHWAENDGAAAYATQQLRFRAGAWSEKGAGGRERVKDQEKQIAAVHRMPMTETQFLEALRKRVRAEHGTWRKFALAIGVSPAYASCVKRGVKPPAGKILDYMSVERVKHIRYVPRRPEGEAGTTLPVDDTVRVKTLLRMLWLTYDAGGISMGRSYEAVVLEAALSLMEDVENEEIPECGDLLNETRNYLSQKMHDHLGLG